MGNLCREPGGRAFRSKKVCTEMITDEGISGKGEFHMIMLFLIGFLVIREAFDYAMEAMENGNL